MECPASQTEGEVFAPKPAGAGDEGAAAAAAAQTSPAVVSEDTLALESTEAGVERATAAAMT